MNISIQKQPLLAPRKAIIFYEGNTDYSVATYHKIHRNGELSAGKNIDVNDLEELFRSNGKGGMNFLPENVLAVKNNSIVWFEKSRKHKIFFNTEGKDRLALNQYSGREVIWPALLFMIRQETLHCWALGNNRRPTLKTPVYIAPLTHISEINGQVCLPHGLRLLSGVNPQDNMRLVSESFYNGIFGHGTGSMRQINHPGGHDGFWTEYLKKDKHTGFPVELLKPTNKNLEDILQ